MIPPGKTIGMMGGGQLGRMSVLAGRRLGYRFHVYEPAAHCAAGMVADREFNSTYVDEAALAEFARSVDVVTMEFENIPSDALRTVEKHVRVRPGATVLHITQNRRREKEFLRVNKIPHAPFSVVESAAELAEVLSRMTTPGVLKTADFGYDGKGQSKIPDPATADANALWTSLGAPAGVVEQFIDFQGECSVIVARNADGQMATFPMAENIHTRHILDLSIVPSRFGPDVERRGAELAREIAELLDVVGLLAVEFFVTKSGDLLVNELAPRPHNSGHYTFDACKTSQFEQHIRAVCNLPLGSTDLLSPVVMVNLLGDLWGHGDPDWRALLRDPQVKLDLYDKGLAKPGRKMGHFCVLTANPNLALKKAVAYRDQLRLNAKLIQNLPRHY